MWELVDTWIGRLSRACGFLAGCIIVGAVGLLVTNIALRVFSTPLLGVVELISHAMLATIMLALPYTHRVQAHIRIRLLTDQLTAPKQLVFEVNAHALTMFAAGWIAYMYGYRTLSGGAVMPTGLLDIPELPFRILVVIGFGLWALEALCSLVRTIVTRRTDSPQEPARTPEARS